MLRDERLYPNPSEFNPDRYIPTEGKEPQQDPRMMCFGFGRRICPGLNLADASLWISCAMSLAVFDIKKAVENGVEITPVVDSTPGTIR
jgi:cytochrome P450